MKPYFRLHTWFDGRGRQWWYVVGPEHTTADYHSSAGAVAAARILHAKKET